MVLHQTPLGEKRNILITIKTLLQKNGGVVIADYGLQRTTLMTTLCLSIVQMLDEIEDTQSNTEGCIPELMKEAGFTNVKEIPAIPTFTASISIYSGLFV